MIKEICMKLYKRKVIIVFALLLSFLIGYFITSISNNYNGVINCYFTSDIQININDFVTEEKLLTIRDSAEKYQNINVEKLFSNNDFSISETDGIYHISTEYSYYDEFYLSSQNNISTRGKKFIEDYLNTYVGEENIHYLDEKNIIEITNMYSPYLGGLYALICGLVISAAIIIILPMKKDDNFYDLSDTFPSPFYKGYWKGSLDFVKDVRKITITAMLFALMLVSKLLVLPSGFANLGLSFGFIFFSLITALFGPIAGLVIGFFSDTIGFFLFDTSGTGFFIGYVIQAMFTGFIYGLFLYKSKISFPRILLMRLVIGIFSNVIIGGISWGIVAGYNMSQTLYYMLLFSLPKNLIYLIPQSLLLFAVFKLLMPVLSRFGLINKKIADQIKLI